MHGPGGQDQHIIHEYGDACFAKVVAGQDILQRLFDELPVTKDSVDYEWNGYILSGHNVPILTAYVDSGDYSIDKDGHYIMNMTNIDGVNASVAYPDFPEPPKAPDMPDFGKEEEIKDHPAE